MERFFFFFYLSNQLLWFWNRSFFAVTILCIAKTLYPPNSMTIPTLLWQPKGVSKKCPNVALGHHFLALRRTSRQDFGIWLKITLKCDNLLVSNLWANERPSRLAVPSVQSSLVYSTHSDSKCLILWRITDIACSFHLPRGCKINRNCCGGLSVQMVL